MSMKRPLQVIKREIKTLKKLRDVNKSSGNKFNQETSKSIIQGKINLRQLDLTIDT